MNRVIQIATNINAKRGRQIFIILLGKKKYQQFAPIIASQIIDENVSGHVIDTLLKMQILGYVEIIRPFADSKFTWIRNKAKKYSDKYSDK